MVSICKITFQFHNGDIILMHICYIIWNFKSPKNFTNMGGAEKQLLKIIKNVESDKDKQITIISKKMAGDLDKESISSNKEIQRINVTNYRFISMFIFNILLFFKIINLHKKKPIDLIVLQLSDIFIITVYILRYILKIPILTRIATTELYPNKRKGLWLYVNRFIRYIILKSDGMQTLNPLSYYYAKKLGYNDKKLFLIPNGVDIPNEMRNYKKITKNILYIGRMNVSAKNQFVDSKNLLFLINVFRELLKKKPDLTLTLVGDGNYRSTLEKTVIGYGLQDKIIFTGYQTDIQKYLLKADIFVNPSLHEGMPNTVIEAMAFGIYVMCSNIPEHRFIIENEENGILFNHKSKDDFIQKTIEFYKNPKEHVKIAKKGREYVIQNLSMKKISYQILDMYINVYNQYKDER